MCLPVTSTHDLLPLDSATRDTSLSWSTLTPASSGGVLDIDRASDLDWQLMIRRWVAIDVVPSSYWEHYRPHPEMRAPAEHLAHIRRVLNPPIVDLASVFGVSRQAVYKWFGGTVTPETDKLKRIHALSRVADAFLAARIPPRRASALVKMKIFAGRALMDLVAEDTLDPKHIQTLIDEAEAMDAAYNRSGLTRTKAKPSDDWKSELSIPGYPE